MRLTPNLYALFPSLFYIYTTQCYYDLLPWDCSQFNWFSSREKVLIPCPSACDPHLRAVAVVHPLPNKIILLTNCCSVYNIFCCRNNNIYSLFLFLFCADVLVPFPWCLCVPHPALTSPGLSPLYSWSVIIAQIIVLLLLLLWWWWLLLLLFPLLLFLLWLRCGCCCCWWRACKAITYSQQRPRWLCWWGRRHCHCSRCYY